WHEDDPRDTPVRGDYSFSNADLGTLKGIGGILSSTGRYAGTLSDIVVDGTSGDTHLSPVKAKLLHSFFTAKGSVTRIQGRRGHDIELDVVVEHAEIEDLLKAGVRTDPPVMTGPVKMRTKLSLLPGEGDVADRLHLAGNFDVQGGHFTNQKVQSRLDALSLRTQGKGKAQQENPQDPVATNLRGIFKLEDGL